MAVASYLRQAAQRGTASMAKSKAAVAARVATKAKTAAPAAPGVFSLLGKGKILQAFKANPAGMGIGAMFLINMLVSRLLQHQQTMGSMGAQTEHLQAMGGMMNPEDSYYQAMMPSITQERQGAQNALLQAIMAGSGQEMSVPGERVIGGGGGYGF